MNFSSRLLTLVPLLAFAATAPAQTTPAADSVASSEATIELDPLVVLGERGESLTIPSPDSARAGLRLTPGGVEFIEASRFLRGRSSTVDDTFALSPGIVAKSRFGSDEARLSIRGSGLQRTFHGRGLRVLQDGVPLNLADGGFDFQALEPTAAAYINVWRGANALAYGSSTLGGAIEYVSRVGRDAPAAFARVEAGSWGYLRANVAGGGTRGDADAYLSFTHQSQEGFRDHAEQSNQRLFSNVGWRFSDRVETRLYATAVRTDSFLPGNLTKDQLEETPRQANAGNINLDQKRDFDLLRIASKTTLRVGSTLFDLNLAFTYKDLDHPIFQVIDQLSQDTLIGLNLTHFSELLGRKQLLRGGVLLNRGRTAAAQFTNAAGKRGAIRQRDDQVAANLEGFLEDQITLGRGFTGVLGFSVAQNSRRNTRLLTTTNTAGLPGATPANATYDRTYDQFAPKIGFRWQADPRGVELFGNVSGSYEPPSFSESGTTGTTAIANRAQKATTIELGSRGALGPVRWDASLYRAAIKDELLAVQLPPPAALGQTNTINADRTIHQGVELGLETDLLGRNPAERRDQRVVARLAWTYGDFTFDRYRAAGIDYAGKQIAGVPPHLVRGELLWENNNGLYAGPTFEWVPVKSTIDHRNTSSAGAYGIVGFKIGRRGPKGLSWFVEAKNLTNEKYAASYNVVEVFNPAAAAQFLPGDGRGFFAGLDYAF